MDNFYNETLDKELRFGDVLRGFIFSTPAIHDPLIRHLSEYGGYTIDINKPLFSIVLTPCCSIGDKIITLSPLFRIRSGFFDNEYLAEDLTNINREMEPEQSVPKHIWDGFTEAQKQERRNEGKSYAFIDLFIYEKNDLFPEYTVHRRTVDNITTNYYMIDFRNLYKFNCDKIIRTPENPLEAKCSQLSIQTRAELRNKMAKYFGRAPKEDIIT